ncbi:MAG: pyruvate kinase [Limisphaerales bacterium]
MRVRPASGPNVAALSEHLARVRRRMVHAEESLAKAIAVAHPAWRASARNLAHYVGLRSLELRSLQAGLARLGLSSLGRADSHVLGNVDAVLAALAALAGTARPGAAGTAGLGYDAGRRRLERHTRALFGPRAGPPRGRILVTLADEAGRDPALVRECFAAGMDCARINCSAGTPESWSAIVEALERGRNEFRRECPLLMDLGGPKLRLGLLPPGPGVVHLRPLRDDLGRHAGPARLRLVPMDAPPAAGPPDEARVTVARDWLRQVRAGDRVTLRDTRGRAVALRVRAGDADGWCAETDQSAFLTNGTRLRLQPGRPRRLKQATGTVAGLPPSAPAARLHVGDRVRLLAGGGIGSLPPMDAAGRPAGPVEFPLDLPAAFAAVKAGDPVRFDDGRLEGVVRGNDGGCIEVEITQAGPAGTRLRGGKGISFPETALALGGLTAKDLSYLGFVARHADLVGLSFVNDPADVLRLQAELRTRGAAGAGIVLKIETQRAFARLPELLFTAMRAPRAGVMIARGDLAVECGWERLAEVQEEILWFCEAAHMPVIWATQVLESLAKKGVPSRSEITDAAMSQRAECVMLNKGPHIVAAIRSLDQILTRMAGHQAKKSPQLRRLGIARLADTLRPA